MRIYPIIQKKEFVCNLSANKVRLKARKVNRIAKTLCLTTLAISLNFSGQSTAYARGEITVITTETEQAIPSTYDIGSQTYLWGQGNDLKIVSFEYNNTTYKYETLADNVVFRRVDNNVSTGNRCAIFAAKSSDFTYQPSYPSSDGKGNCDLAAVMSGRTINLGVLDVFSNDVGHGSEKNIERVDFIYTSGINSPKASGLSQAGHVATEKSGNNWVKIAAILSLDSSGNPASYGPLILIHPQGSSCNAAVDLCYGLTNISANLAQLSNNANPPQNDVSEVGEQWETLGMTFVSLEDLSVPANDKYYGFSYFASDTDPSAGHILTDPTTFPRDTVHIGVESPGDADMYGGVAGYFVDDECIDCFICDKPKPLNFGTSGRFNIREINTHN